MRRNLKLFAALLLIASLFATTATATTLITKNLNSTGTINAVLPPSTMALHVTGNQILDSQDANFYPRGIGLAGFAPSLYLWGEGQTDNWNLQFSHNQEGAIRDTFQELRDNWGVNTVRLFIYPSWYWRGDIVPAQESSNFAWDTTPINIKTYLQNLCTIGEEYGMYVNIVPYSLTPWVGSYDLDPYATPNWVGSDGLPYYGWDEAGQRFLADAGFAGNEAGFWSAFWSKMGNDFKDYPNAILEAWNEPQAGADNVPMPDAYLNYVENFYTSVRNTGNDNLLYVQYKVGWFPNGYGNDLSWCSQVAQRLPNAVNLAYTTHLYYYAPSDLSSFWGTLSYANQYSQLAAAIDSMGVNAPLVFNEAGSCLAHSSNQANDVLWWGNVVSASRDLNSGVTAYYWLSDDGIGSVFAGETLLQGQYTPNAMGQAFIDNR